MNSNANEVLRNEVPISSYGEIARIGKSHGLERMIRQKLMSS